MMEISKLIEALKGISKSNLLVIVFSVILILLVYNFSSYAPHIESLMRTVYEFRVNSTSVTEVYQEEHDYVIPPEVTAYKPDNIVQQDVQSKNKYVVTLEDMDISKENLTIIQGYADESFSLVYNLTNQLPVFMAIYKFIPEGDDRYFQGRILVSEHTNLTVDLDLMLKEAGLIWIPMWVNKGTLERVMFDESFLSELIVTTNRRGVFLEDDLETRGKVNMTILYDIGVRWYYYYPITKGDYPIGYLVWALYNKPSESDLNHIHSKSVVLSTRIYNYMLNNKM